MKNYTKILQDAWNARIEGLPREVLSKLPDHQISFERKVVNQLGMTLNDYEVKVIKSPPRTGESLAVISPEMEIEKIRNSIASEALSEALPLMVQEINSEVQSSLRNLTKILG